jgi:hypothetical protein
MPYLLSEQGVKALRLSNRYILTVGQMCEPHVVMHLLSMT